MRLIFRADGDAAIGLGHVVRSLALADMVRPVGPCWLAVRAPGPAVRDLLAAAQVAVLELPAASDVTEFTQLLRVTDLVVLDGYGFDLAYQEAVRARGCRLVCLDDLQAGACAADLIINHSPGVHPQAYQARPHTRFCLGPAFSLLRAPFLLNAQAPQAPTQPRSVLLCFGGADPLGLTARYLRALLAVAPVRLVSVVLGGANTPGVDFSALAAAHPEKQVRLHRSVSAAALVALCQSHEVVLCPASTVLIESLVLGKAVVTGHYADNQRRLAGYVAAHGQAYSLGDLCALPPEALPAALQTALTWLGRTPRTPYVEQLRPDVLRAEFQRLADQPA